MNSAILGIPIPIAAIFSVSLLVVLFVFVFYNKDKREFKKIFLFFPSPKIIRQEQEQEIVDTTLQTLAKSFFIVADEETKVLKYIKRLKGDNYSDHVIGARLVGNGMLKAINVITVEGLSLSNPLFVVTNTYKKELKKRKEEFRRAQRAGRNFDFLILKNIGDYIL